jgi:hypothetical protein
MPSSRRVSNMADQQQPSPSLGHVIFWRYPRGSWQYDILCLLILAFIFLTPRAVFDGSYFDDAKQATDQVSGLTGPAPTSEPAPGDANPLSKQP